MKNRTHIKTEALQLKIAYIWLSRLVLMWDDAVTSK